MQAVAITRHWLSLTLSRLMTCHDHHIQQTIRFVEVPIETLIMIFRL